jgi:signal transduction histidine kinase
MNVVQNTLASGDSYEVEFRVVWPDESIHWLGARGAVLRDGTGSPTKIIGIALEVTQRHQTEKALRESEKLAATGRLAATIAHEINNPLEAVVNLVFLAKSDPRLTPELRKILDTADAELARVSHMVRQTLGFYRESTNPVWSDLAEMTVQIIALYRNKMQRKNLKIDVQVSSAQVYGFEGELRQVISNLISNAIDAVDHNGNIRVHVRPSGDRVRIVGADNGHGIAPEHRTRLFQPFFTTKKDVGTGLGLWVSKGIVDKHHGQIRVRTTTRTGRSGTVFAVELPLQAVTPIAQSATLAS